MLKKDAMLTSKPRLSIIQKTTKTVGSWNQYIKILSSAHMVEDHKVQKYAYLLEMVSL